MKLNIHIAATLVLLIIAQISSAQNKRYSIRGEVLSSATGKGIPFATVVVEEQPTLGASADEAGCFEIFGVKPGIYRFGAYSLGYEPTVTAEYIVSANSASVEITMRESPKAIDTLVVVRSLFQPVLQSPVSMRRIGLQQIEKSAGANRDLSRVVQSYPGVAFSPASYRNDLIVRGGSPSENRFYVDGFAIPNINHFSTQGASGGPVGLINADLIREIELYSGAFPLSTSGALSSVIDIELRNGNPDKQNFKATVGASEVGISGSGHLSPKSDYIFSARRSYLQLLFKALELPFLPDFYDAQIKVRTKLSPSDQLNFLAIGAIDDMTLNDSASTPSGEYILGYLPRIQQNTLTLGASYRHFSGDNSYGIYLSHSVVANDNEKYRDNDKSRAENLLIKLTSTENRTLLRNRNRAYRGDFTINYGAQLGATSYSVESRTPDNRYSESLRLFEWGIFAGAEYKDSDERFTASAGIRADASSYSKSTKEIWRQLSPRVALSYKLGERCAFNIGSGVYHQLPPLTSLSYRQAGELVNRDISYVGVWESTLGFDYNPRREIQLSIEGFYKGYSDILLSLEKGVPLWDLGADYGAIGGEALTQCGRARAYGVELMARAELGDKLSAIASLTLFSSEFQRARHTAYLATAWDNRYIFNMSGSYSLPRRWRVGAKIGAIGGAPYTPYDTEQSALVEVWDATGRAMVDYVRYNSERSPGYYQVDIRIDKSYYFERWALELYIDIQNITASKLALPDIPVATSEVVGKRYTLAYIKNINGTILPTIGVSVEF